MTIFSALAKLSLEITTLKDFSLHRSENCIIIYLTFFFFLRNLILVRWLNYKGIACITNASVYISNNFVVYFYNYERWFFFKVFWCSELEERTNTMFLLTQWAWSNIKSNSVYYITIDIVHYEFDNSYGSRLATTAVIAPK